MRAEVIRFPLRHSATIRIIRDGPAWLVLALDHGWLHGSLENALADAGWLSANLGLPLCAGET
jgi:hypothetical protein